MKLVVEIPKATVADLDKRLYGYATRSELVRSLIRDYIAATPLPGQAPQAQRVTAPVAVGRGRTELPGLDPLEWSSLDKWVRDL